MSVAEHDEDDDDREVCPEHGYELPCRVCRDQAAIDRAERDLEEWH